MTPPEWKRLLYAGGDDDPKRILVLETLNGLTEIAFCPSDVAVTHIDYDEADEYSRAGLKEDVAEAEVERARERAGKTLDEQAAREVLSECRERAERVGERQLIERIDEVLAPVRASISGEVQTAPPRALASEEHRRRRDQGGE